MEIIAKVNQKNSNGKKLQTNLLIMTSADFFRKEIGILQWLPDAVSSRKSQE